MSWTRRRLLKSAAASALPLTGMSGLSTATPVRESQAAHTDDGSFDPWVEWSASNVRHNVAEIARRVEGRPILAVIKNNGYGMGVTRIAGVLDAEQAVHTLAVVKMSEAHALRDAGIRKPVLCMGPFSEKELTDAVARDITPMVYTDWQQTFARLANEHQRAIPAHLCLDTGMGRVGIPYELAGPLAEAMAESNSIALQGVMTTLSEDPELDPLQVERLTEFAAGYTTEGATLGLRHAASSFGLFELPAAFLDAVRPGMAVFGVYSEQRFRGSDALALRPAVALRTRVAYVKRLNTGASAGYNRAYTASRPVYIATLPIGHVDGLPRAASEGGRVTIGGKSYPIIASISASHTIIEIGDEPEVEAGQVATLFDWNEGSRVEDFAAGFSGSVYDLMMHLNPLLPRHAV